MRSLRYSINILSKSFLNCWFTTKFHLQKVTVFSIALRECVLNTLNWIFTTDFKLFFSLVFDNYRRVLWFKVFTKLFYFNKNVIKNLKNFFNMLYILYCRPNDFYFFSLHLVYKEFVFPWLIRISHCYNKT